MKGELREFLKQVGWKMGNEFQKDLSKAIERYGQDLWSEGYREGLNENND